MMVKNRYFFHVIFLFPAFMGKPLETRISFALTTLLGAKSNAHIFRPCLYNTVYTVRSMGSLKTVVANLFLPSLSLSLSLSPHCFYLGLIVSSPPSLRRGTRTDFVQ